jgi:hypothetical protein
MLMAPIAVPELPLLSTALTVKLAAGPLTAAVGVPVIAPVAAFRVKPAGREPTVIEKVKVPVPPVAVKEAL